MPSYIIIGMIFVFLMIVFYLIYQSTITETFQPDYLGFPSKCFSCERDMIRQGLPVQLAHPAKCLDCQNSNDSSEQQNKCFSCER